MSILFARRHYGMRIDKHGASMWRSMRSSGSNVGSLLLFSYWKGEYSSPILSCVICGLTLFKVITTEFRMANPIQKGTYEDSRHFVLRRRPKAKARRSSELDSDGIRSTVVKTLELIFGQSKRSQIRDMALDRFKRECYRCGKKSFGLARQAAEYQKLINQHLKMLRMWPSNLHFIQSLATDIFNFLQCIPIDRTLKRIKVYTAVLVRIYIFCCVYCILTQN